MTMTPTMVSAPVERVDPPSPRLMKVVNPIVRRLVTWGWPRAVIDHVLVLHFAGRWTGRPYSVPIAYHDVDGKLTLITEAAWRANLRGGAAIEVTYRGERVPAVAMLVEEPDDVAFTLEHLLEVLGPETAEQRLGLHVTSDELPTRTDLVDLVTRTRTSLITLDLEGEHS